MKYFLEKDTILLWNFEFNNFSEALNFVNKVGETAESSNHHPNIMLHNYRFVEVSTTTHDAGNMLTEKDYSIAEKIEELYQK